MPNIFNDGTQVDQIIFNDQTVVGQSGAITSDYMVVPALYTGRLEVVFMGGSTACTLKGTPSIEIQYYGKAKASIHNWTGYIGIPANTSFDTGKIMTEFHIPYRKLKEITNGDKVFYIKIKLTYTQTDSVGSLNAYLIWK